MKVSAGTKVNPVPQGLHLGICTEVVDLGTQDTTWEGKKKSARKVALRFELPHVLIEEGDHAGKPRSIGNTYTASLGEKANLRKLLESWRGQKFTADELKGFNLNKLLGKPCQLQIIHEEKNGKTYANIASIVGIMPGTPIPAVTNELRSFDLDEYDDETFAGLPDWQREQIVKSPEYQAVAGKGDAYEGKPGVAQGTDPDDIPF